MAESSKYKFVQRIHQDAFTDRKVSGKSGYVYVVRSGGLYKIGKTRCPKKRIGSFETLFPTYVYCFICVPVENCSKEERYLHRRLKSSRRHGEWFDLEDKDLDFIVRHLTDKTD